MFHNAILVFAAWAALETGATSVAPVADIMIVKDEASVAGCAFLGEVKGSSAWGGLVTNMAYNRARDGLKKRALALRATHVVLLDSSSGAAGSNMLGNAYKCPTKDPEAR